MADSNKSGGIGFFGALGLIFIALKLLGVIKWSWWYVTMPLWGGAAFALTFLVFVLAIMGLAAILKD